VARRIFFLTAGIHVVFRGLKIVIQRRQRANYEVIRRNLTGGIHVVFRGLKIVIQRRQRTNYEVIR
jgi:hypothetical protein